MVNVHVTLGIGVVWDGDTVMTGLKAVRIHVGDMKKNKNRGLLLCIQDQL